MGNPRLTIESVISTLDRVANGSTRYPGKRESIGEHHRIERECRDRLRAALGDMSATLDRIDNLLARRWNAHADLLAACEAALQWYEGGGKCCGGSYLAWAQQISAAIAKARGE